MSLQVFYKTQAQALRDVKRGKIVGYIEFAHNFSQSFAPFNDKVANNPSRNGFIQVQLDHSDLHKMGYIKQMIYENYKNVMKKLMKECGRPKKGGGFPINVEAMFGELSFDFRRSMIPSVLLG
jgi:hypothetical protein